MPTTYGTLVEAPPPRRSRAAGYVAVAVASGSLLSALAVWARDGQSLRAGSALTTDAASSEAARVAYADYTVSAACADYDDDAVFAPTCPSFDAESWCATDITDKGTPFAALCPDACADQDMAWAMPCAWMAVKSLPESCAGTFRPDIAGLSSQNADSPGGLPNPLTLGGKSQLYNCDEHAVCFSCYNAGNAGTTDDAKYCEAVATYYGGFGVPLVEGADSWTLRAPGGFAVPGLEVRGDMGITEAAGEVGANAAWRAINEDWDFWCDDATLAAIEDGSFADRYAPSK